MRDTGDPIFVRDTIRVLGPSYTEYANPVLGLFGIGAKQVNTPMVEKEAMRRFVDKPLHLDGSPSLAGRVFRFALLAGVAYGIYSTGIISQIPSVDLSGITSVVKGILGF